MCVCVRAECSGYAARCLVDPMWQLGLDSSAKADVPELSEEDDEEKKEEEKEGGDKSSEDGGAEGSDEKKDEL